MGNGPDTELTLTEHPLRAVVSPYGASLRGLYLQEGADEQEIITVYTGAANKVGGQGDVLIPFPGRVNEGRYAFEGQRHQLRKNDKEAPAAIHGFLRQVMWAQQERTGHSITFATAFDEQAHAGYPFALAVQVGYALQKDGLHCSYQLRNTGTGNAPVGAGFHPYFKVGAGWIDNKLLHVPFRSVLQYEDLLPTGKVLPVEGTPFDFRQKRAIGSVALNTCYLHPDRDAAGMAHIQLADPTNGRTITVSLDRSFASVVLYSGDPLPPSHRRRALAIEPGTCGVDALNHPDWGLMVLKPGEKLTGEWSVALR